MSKDNDTSESAVENMEQWQFCQHPIYTLLPIDDNTDNQVYVRNVVFSEAQIRPLENEIRLVCVSNDALINILNMDPKISHTSDFVDFIAGKKLPLGAFPVSHRYGGHQYGMWISQLGDGRAHVIGEYVNKIGERWQLQLKGSGQTPYSRCHDGRAVLRSSIREMVASEACHFLGIPTTRAAALVVSDETVIRDKFYNGNPRLERVAMLLRLAPSWFRFGSLEIHAYDEEIPLLSHLCDFIIKVYFPNIHLNDENRYIRLFSEISHRTLDMLAKWQGFGFCHGLLNTDNMSILGLTLDYGPFGFVDSYDGGFVPNSSDTEGRYALAKQPDVVLWNISQLANSFKPLLTETQLYQMTQIMKNLVIYCRRNILETFLLKLGLNEDRWGDEQLVEKLLDIMQDTGADYTVTFRQLAELEPEEMTLSKNLENKWCLKRLSTHSSWGCWLEQYKERVDKEAAHASEIPSFEVERRRRMSTVNPVYVPRNWMMEEAIQDAENNDFEKVEFLLEVLKNPFVIQEEAERKGFSSEPPWWAYTLKVSCSS